mgnify:CR=1 FL=1
MARYNNDNGKKGKKRKEQAPRRGGGFAVFLVFLLLLAGAGYIGYTYVLPLYGDVITDGVQINGKDFSGMTRDQALAALSAHANDKAGSISVTIRYKDRVWQYGANEMNASTDLSPVIDAAMAIAHTGGVMQRYEEAKAAVAGAYRFDTTMLINAENMTRYLNEIKLEIDESPVDATMQFSCAGDKYTIEGHGYWEDGVDYSPLFVTTPEAYGRQVDVEATMELLRADIADDYIADVNLVVRDMAPEITEQSLRDQAVLLYHSSSKLRGSTADRTWNIKLALSNFDGMIIAPGQEVSFNDIVGKRTEDRGYRKAHTIDGDGALVDDLGGGICQAATTLFNAAIQAGCEVMERNPHKWPLYNLDYDWGLDAMVNWGTSDMKFKNTTGGNLYLDFYLVYSGNTPTYIDIDIYGLPPADGADIVMEVKKVSETEPAPPRYEAKTDAQIAALVFENSWVYDAARNQMVYEWVTPRTGYVYDVYRVWKKDGAEIKREKLYTSTYKPIQGVFYTKAAAPTAPPAATPTPEPAVTPTPEPPAVG